jgi:hypothetical protein
MLVVLAALSGLVFMHQLVGATGMGGHDHSVQPAASAGHADPKPAASAGHADAEPAAERERHCPSSEDDCQAPPPGHPGHTCQLTVPSLPAGVAPPMRTATPDHPTLAVPLSSPHTVAHDAAGGTGCGPPALTEISVWRI